MALDFIEKHVAAKPLTAIAPVLELTTHFDYSRIDDAKTRDRVKIAAQRIHENNNAVRDKFLENGRILIGIKAEIAKAGETLWTDWLKEEFAWSTRTAQNYIAVAERFGDAYADVCYLPSPLIYALASGKAMDDARAMVIEAAQLGEPLPKADVQALIAQNRVPAQKKPERPDAAAKAARRAITLIGDRLGTDAAEIAKLILKAGPTFARELKAVAHG
jgi:hypothetical protein